MNPQPPFPPHDDLEARITALLLGELPETEAAALRREIAASTALQKLHDELARTIGLVREARGAADEKTGPTAEPLTLSSDKRDRLLAAFKTVPLPVAGKKRRLVVPWREAASVAAMLAVLAGVTTLVLNRGLQPEDTLSDRMALFFGREKFYKKPGGVTPLPMMDTAWSDQSQTVRLFASDAASSSLDVRAARVEAEFAAARGSVPPSGQVPLLNPAGEPVVNDPIVVMRKRVDREVEEMDAEWKTRGGNDLKALLKEPAPAANDYGGNASGTPALTVADSRTAPERPVTRFAIALPTAPEQAKAGADDFNALSRGGTPALGVENRWASSSATAFDEAPVASTFFRQTGQPQSLAQTDLSRRADAAGAKDGSTWEFRSSGRAREQVAMQSESKVAAAGDLFGDADRYAAAVPPPSKPLGSVAPEGMKANYGRSLSSALPSGGGLGGGAAGVGGFAGGGRGVESRLDAIELHDGLAQVPALPVAVSGPAPAQAANGTAWFKGKSVPEREQQALAFQAADQKDSFGTELKSRLVTAAGTSAPVLTDGLADAAVEFNQPAPAPMAAYRFPVADRGYFFDASGPEKGAKGVDKELADQPMPVGAVMLSDNVESRVQQLQEVEAVRLVNQSGLEELNGTVKPAAPAPTLDLSTINGRELGLEQLSAPGAHGDFILSKSKNQVGGNVGDPEWIGALESPAKSDVKVESLRRLSELSVDEGLQVVDGERSVIKRSIVLPASGTADSGVIVAGKPATAETPRNLATVAASSVVRNRQLASLKQVEQRAKVAKLEDAATPRTPAPNAAVPQPEVATAENAFSTFSLNVADVSFKLTAASLEKGAMPDVSTIRSEEFINAFDYRDPEPPAGVPIAFATERARYPFAHDRDLVRFSVKTAAVGRQPGKPFNIVLAIDNSGSMERADRVRILQECIRTLGSQLLPEDRISVVSFARTARLWVDGLPAGQAGNLAERVGQLAPEGGTNLEEAMNIAYKTALRHFVPGGVNRVVLITDGAANLGEVEPDLLKQKVEAFRKQGIALDCFGIGWDGFNDDLLEVLSRNGDGRYGFINTPEAAATEFAGQLAGALKVAASDVKVQVEWNPRRVTSYRQIGYAKHQLKKEQFRDNTVDAAEIGAAEAGNALYTVQVNPAGEGPLATVRVRFRVPNTSDYREHEWIVPYATPAPALDQASSTLRLAATASAFSEWLVASPFAAEVTPDKLLGYLRGVPEMRPADPRPKQLETMIRQAKTISGQ